jgi:hypothetical protein
MNQPDFLSAAVKASELLIQHGICTAPVDPLPVLKNWPGVFVVSFTEMSEHLGIDRKDLVSICGDHNQDAVTSVHFDGDSVRYIVAYNQQLPFHIVKRALARELGHIALGHDGSRPEDVRNEEAKCFTHHFLTPRALVHTIQATGIRFTTEVLGNLTGCNDFCLNCMRRLPAVAVPAELNRAVRDQMMPYMINYFEFQRYATHKDGSPLADLGTYMDGYIE